MSVRYLSDEWASAVTDAVNADAAFTAIADAVTLTVSQTVTGAPSGDVQYLMGIANGAAFIRLGDDGPSDLQVTQDWATAIAIAKGELNLQSAFMQGRVKVTGNLALAMQYQPQLQSLEGALSGVQVSYE